MRAALAAVAALVLSGCGTFNGGLTTSSSDGEFKTTVVFGFAVIRESVPSVVKKADISDISSFGLLYDSKSDILGVGYLSGVYSRIFEPYGDMFLDVRKEGGKLSIRYESVKPNREVGDEEDGSVFGPCHDGPAGHYGAD